MQGLQCEYARSLNLRHDLRGHLWQACFHASVMNEFHLGIALAYVEMNPVRAGITAKATGYEWSSARAHTGHARPPAWLDMKSFTTRFNKEDWTNILANKPDDREELAAIRRATRHDEPFAAPGFVRSLEDAHNLRLLRRPPGRPMKTPLQVAC